MSIDGKKIFCCYCGRWIVFPLKDTAEHLVPLSKGGNDRPINKRRCCHRCNTWRGNTSLDNFKNDVLYYLNERRTKIGYSKLDLETMVENIEYIQQYISTSEDRLLRPHSHKYIPNRAKRKKPFELTNESIAKNIVASFSETLSPKKKRQTIL